MPPRAESPHPLDAIREQTGKLLWDAFDAGYKLAYAEITEHLRKADLTNLLLSQLTRGSDIRHVGDATPAAETPPQPPADAQQQQPPAYGLLTATVRHVIAEAPKRLLFADVCKRANAKGVSMTPSQVREALRRLKDAGLATCTSRRWWKATEELRGEAENENEALNGVAASASDASQRVAPLVSGGQRALTL